MSSSAPETSRWPRQIKYIVGNEACERFSYYGMTGILAGYISGGLFLAWGVLALAIFSRRDDSSAAHH